MKGHVVLTLSSLRVVTGTPAQRCPAGGEGRHGDLHSSNTFQTIRAKVLLKVQDWTMRLRQA